MVIARRLGFALTLTAAGAAGVAGLVRSTATAVAASCRAVGHTERDAPVRGGGPLLDRVASSTQPMPDPYRLLDRSL